MRKVIRRADYVLEASMRTVADILVHVIHWLRWRISGQTIER